jgi:hypothetical protein
LKSNLESPIGQRKKGATARWYLAHGVAVYSEMNRLKLPPFFIGGCLGISGAYSITWFLPSMIVLATDQN